METICFILVWRLDGLEAILKLEWLFIIDYFVRDIVEVIIKRCAKTGAQISQFDRSQIPRAPIGLLVLNVNRNTPK